MNRSFPELAWAEGRKWEILLYSICALIYSTDQSIRELSSNTDSKCSISRPGADEGWPKTTGYRLWAWGDTASLWGPNLIFSSIICSSQFLSFFLKDDWLEGYSSIWLGFMSCFTSSPLPHGYHQHLHSAVRDEHSWPVVTEPTHLKLQQVNMNCSWANGAHAY